MPREEVVRTYNLITGEDTYSSQVAQAPGTARRLKSLIPNGSGLLTREGVQPKYLANAIADGAGGFRAIIALYQYDRNNGDGTFTRQYFCVATGNAHTYLYKSNGVSWATVTDQQGVTIEFPLGIPPMFYTINNLMHISIAGVAGDVAYLYDGTTFKREGFPLPKGAPSFDATVAGTFSATVGRYYWTTFADQSVNTVHESSSSPISAITGVLVNKQVKVFQRKGTVSSTSGSTAIVGVGTDFASTDVGLRMYIDGVDVGLIATVTDPTHLALAVVAAATVATKNFVIVPYRATHWHIYASEAEGSKVGLYLTSVPVTTMFYIDQSPFLGNANSLFTIISRPIRNDPPVPSRLAVVHKSRVFRKRDSRPNFAMFSANEEVRATVNGSPEESYPGTDAATLSDVINEDSYPKIANEIRSMCSHGDALYIATDKDVTPLFGDSVDDFGFSQVVAFSVGFAGRFADTTTSHGMPFLSYDRKLYLFPPNLAYPYIPRTALADDVLKEIGKPIRPRLKDIKISDLDNVRMLWYNYGDRNWLVLAFQDNSSVYHTWIYDFDTQTWFELQRGFTSLGIFEITTGIKVLVGGATDGFVYVIDDQTGQFATSGNLPAATWRPALIDFGKPETYHVLNYMEYEISDAAMKPSITVKYYLDPVDVDNPGTGKTLIFTKVRGANKYRAFFTNTGSFCQRVLIEFTLASDTHAGSFRGVKLVADPASDIVGGSVT